MKGVTIQRWASDRGNTVYPYMYKPAATCMYHTYKCVSCLSHLSLRKDRPTDLGGGILGAGDDHGEILAHLKVSDLASVLLH